MERGGDARREMPGKIGAALVVEVHRQEGDVAGHVHVAEAVVELDAVVDVQRARREVDVFEMQVAVAVANPPRAHPRGKKARVPRVEPVGESADRLEGRA